MGTRTRWLLGMLGISALLLAGCTGAQDDDPVTSGTAEGAGETGAAVAQAPTAGEDRVAAIKERGSLIVGMTLQFEPQMYLDEDGEPAGYDVELMQMLADDLEVELDIRDLEFEALIPGLIANDFDVVSVGLVNRPPRAEQVSFTRPYVPYRQVVVVNSEAGITSLEDLNSPDTRMTALIGSTAASLVTEQFPDAELVELEGQPALLEVSSGSADATVVEEYLALPFVEENPSTEVLNPDQPFSQEYGRLAVPRGDFLWLGYVDNWLDYYTANGTLDRLYTEIIGPTDGLPQ